MIRNTLLAMMLMVTSGVAVAADNTVNLSAQTKLVERGVLATDNATVGLDLRFNDVVLDGAFVRADFDTISDTTPITGSVTFRSDLGVGYGNTLFGNKWELSVNRVLNPVIYAADYTEARLDVARGPLFVSVQQGLTDGVNEDTYAAVGVKRSLGPVTLGGLVSATRYNELTGSSLRDEVKFTNAELFAKYNVWRNVDLNVNYSYGGDRITGEKLDNQVWGGVTVRF